MVIKQSVVGPVFDCRAGRVGLQPPAKRLGKNPGREHHGCVRALLEEISERRIHRPGTGPRQGTLRGARLAKGARYRHAGSLSGIPEAISGRQVDGRGAHPRREFHPGPAPSNATPAAAEAQIPREMRPPALPRRPPLHGAAATARQKHRRCPAASSPPSAAESGRTAGSYGVQLGAFKSGADAANKRWAHLTRNIPRLLSGLSPTVSPKKSRPAPCIACRSRV